jgi:hypothetical protein
MEDTTTHAPPIAEQAKEQVQQTVAKSKQAVQDGKEIAGGLLGKAREQVKTQLVTQKDNAATGLDEVAQALMESSSRLQEHGQAAVAQLGDKAAGKIADFSSYLRDHDINDVVREVETFARRQPALFVGSAVMLGLVAARFLKSSTPDPSTTTSPSGPNGRTGAEPWTGAHNGVNGTADQRTPEYAGSF